MTKQQTTTETKQQTNPFNAWNEGMKSWMDMWQKFSQNLTGFNAPTAGSTFNPDWFKMYDGFTRNLLNASMSSPLKDLYQKYVDTANIYTNLFQSWMQSFEGADKQGSSDSFKGFFNTWMESQKSIFSSLFGLSLPGVPSGTEDLNEWAKGIKQSLESWYGLYQESYQAFMEHWGKMPEKVMEMMRPDVAPEKYKEFYDSWTKSYEATLGKFLKIPMIGPSRQVSDKMMKSVDSFVMYYGSAVDFCLSLYKPSLGTVEELAKKAGEMFKGEATPEKYKKFYELLIKTFEEKFYELFRSPAFADILKATTNASLDFRQHYFSLIEEMLKSTPITTHQEMDAVYKDLYTLKKRVKELERYIKKNPKTS